MSVLTKSERNSLVGRVFLGGVLAALIAGSVTMIYPFVLMISGSLRSEMDSADMSAVPRFLYNDTELTRKFLETKYNNRIRTMNRFRGYQDFSFRQATLPDRIVPQRLLDYARFVEEANLPDHWWSLGGTEIYKRVVPPNSRRFMNRLREAYREDLDALGQDLGSPLRKWQHITTPIMDWENPRMRYDPSLFYQTYFSLMHDRPLAERIPASLTGWFQIQILAPRYGGVSTENYNRAHTVPLDDFTHFALPRTVPGADQPRLREEWTEFVRSVVNASFVRTTASSTDYRNYLKEKYGDIRTLNDRWETELTGFEAVSLPRDTEWIPSSQGPDYQAFLNLQPVGNLYLVGPEFAWQDWLAETYGSLEAANQAHQRNATEWRAFRIPTNELEWQHVHDHASDIRREAATRNFRTVFSEIIFQGRPFLNTVIYVLLALLFSLTLQPLAAYALSRFNPPFAWRIILIFMATMAFPPMVGMIPQFLILRKLDLLNTYFGLVLPGIVNGYLIFLMKGFFDSLPKHLYEAALIDGAGEFRMFTTITMSLSKPILAVVALGTFNHAWLAFMYPLLVCPKEEMHVLAIWLYSFQQEALTSAVFASILITSIPSLLIFLFAQRTIMRGIAVPAEK